jgi:hypothetical protein
MTRAHISLDRLQRHARDVLKRMDRGILHAKVSSGEMDRLLDKREAYRVRILEEMRAIANRIAAQARHAESLANPKRKQHKQRGRR